MAMPRRVFIGLTEISGYFSSLQKGFHQWGIPCDLYDLGGHPFRYQAAGSPGWVRLLRAIESRQAARFGPVCRLGYKLVYALMVLHCLVRYDVFIFTGGTKFYRYTSLRLLKALNKKVVYIFLGSDSRPPYLDGSVMVPGQLRRIPECIALAASMKAAMRVIERYADVVIDFPAAGHFHERPFVNGVQIGFPHAHDRPTGARPAPRKGGPVRILHCPSHPEAKGTAVIRAAVEAVRQRGYAIDFVEVSGQPNAVVLAELERCDFVVDQLYSDTPMAGFATEAAYHGRAAVVGGYYAASIQREMPPDLLPPTLYCHPDGIEHAIERLVRDRAFREDLGARARAFVEQTWSPREVAARFARLIAGERPPLWLYDPSSIRHVHGVCMPEQRAQALIRAVLAAGGPAALQLADKPALEQALIAFAQAPGPDAQEVV